MQDGLMLNSFENAVVCMAEAALLGGEGCIGYRGQVFTGGTQTDVDQAAALVFARCKYDEKANEMTVSVDQATEPMMLGGGIGNRIEFVIQQSHPPYTVVLC